MENKEYCSAAFLDVSQAFDRVWYDGLLYKIKIKLPNKYSILKSYLKEKYYQVISGEAVTGLYPIATGVPQGSVLEPLLYLLYTADLPTSHLVTIGTFAGDTAILASHTNPITASTVLQDNLNKISIWKRNWRIKTNKIKSVHVTFTTRQGNCPPIKINNVVVPQVEHVKYLGIYLNRRLIWKKHIFTKRKQLGF